jgi:hypothetical protein
LPIFSDGSEKVWVALLSVVSRDRTLGRVGDDHRAEVLGDASNRLNRVGTGRAFEKQTNFINILTLTF